MAWGSASGRLPPVSRPEATIPGLRAALAPNLAAQLT